MTAQPTDMEHPRPARPAAATLRALVAVFVVAALVGLTEDGRRLVAASVAWIRDGFLAVFVDAGNFIAGCF